MLNAYRQHVAERAALGIPPLPLDAQQTAELIELIKAPPKGEEAFLLDLLTHRVPPGVDDAAQVKASFLAAVAHGDLKVGLMVCMSVFCARAVQRAVRHSGGILRNS